MLTEKEAADKLREYGLRFNKHVRQKDFGKAHNLYNIAIEVATFMKMGEETMEELFGGYDGEGIPEDDGIFRRSSVNYVNRECCIRRHMAYEDMSCRKQGIPLEEERYYSDTDYCAGCRAKK